MEMEWEEMEQFLIETPTDPIEAAPPNATLFNPEGEHTTHEQQESRENSRLPTKPRPLKAAKSKKVRSTGTPEFDSVLPRC